MMENLTWTCISCFPLLNSRLEVDLCEMTQDVT